MKITNIKDFVSVVSAKSFPIKSDKPEGNVHGVSQSEFEQNLVKQILLNYMKRINSALENFNRNLDVAIETRSPERNEINAPKPIHNHSR